MQEVLRLPYNITFWIRQLKKKMGHLSKKVIIQAPFHSKAFVLLYKFETRGTLLGRLSRGLFCFVLFSCKLRGLRFSLLTNLLTVLRAIHKKTRQGFEQFGLQNTKIWGGKIYSRTRTSGAKVHTLNILVKRWHNKYEIFN